MTTWLVDLGGALGMLVLLYWAIRGVKGCKREKANNAFRYHISYKAPGMVGDVTVKFTGLIKTIENITFVKEFIASTVPDALSADSIILTSIYLLEAFRKEEE